MSRPLISSCGSAAFTCTHLHCTHLESMGFLWLIKSIQTPAALLHLCKIGGDSVLCVWGGRCFKLSQARAWVLRFTLYWLTLNSERVPAWSIMLNPQGCFRVWGESEHRLETLSFSHRSCDRVWSLRSAPLHTASVAPRIRPSGGSASKYVIHAVTWSYS